MWNLLIKNIITYSTFEEREVHTEISHSEKASIMALSFFLWGREIFMEQLFKDSKPDNNFSSFFNTGSSWGTGLGGLFWFSSVYKR